MQRLTISLDDELAEAFEELMRRRGYANRSEAVRDLLRRELGESDLNSGTSRQCVAVLSYVFDHHERQLSSRLTTMQHDHHDLAIATLHAASFRRGWSEHEILMLPAARRAAYLAMVAA